MKIGFINGGIGISETFIYNFIKGITIKNENTQLYCAQKPYYHEGINYTIIPFFYTPKVWFDKILYNLGQRGRNIKWRKKQNLASKKIESYIEDRDVLFIDYGTTAVQLLPILKELKKKFIVHFHGWDISSALNDTFYKQQLYFLFEHATYLVAASNYVRKLLILSGADCNKIKVIPYGLNPIKINQEIWKERKAQTLKRIIFIGRLTPKKHPIALIKAFELVYKAMPNTHLDVVGDGYLMQECKELVDKLNLKDAITFYGSQPNQKAINFLKDGWMYAQHSVTAPTGDQEGFAISLAEAALCELPVVSTLHNGIPENVIDGQTGYLVKEFDFEDMAEKILLLLNDEELAEKMGKNGRTHITRLCDPEKRIEQIIELFESIVNE